MLLNKKDFILINKKAYDSLACEFEEKINIRKSSSQRIINKFISFLPKNNKKSILELGPAAGYTTKLLTKAEYLVDAIEFSSKLSKICKKHAPLANIFNCDFLKFHISKKKYDGILVIAFVHLFPKKESGKLFTKIKSLLKQDGVAYISTTIHTKSDEGFERKTNFINENIRFRRKFTIIQLQNELIRSGFKIIDKQIIKDPEVKDKKWIDFIVTKK